MKPRSPFEIPVVNLFAGGGGLAEGFCPVGRKRRFRLALAAEMKMAACRTLLLRNFCRAFPPGELPDGYYKLIRNESDIKELWESWPAESAKAERATWNVELGKRKDGGERELDFRLKEAIGNADNWVLAGGPPCQAYSNVGRNRNKKNPHYRPESDNRFFLYREYLKVLGRYRPTAFVLENVIGIFSATSKGRKLFPSIIEDFAEPSRALDRLGLKIPSTEYRLYCLGGDEIRPGDNDLRRFAIHSEKLGLPQARHRMIVIGVRSDIERRPPQLELDMNRTTGAGSVLEDLPKLRSGLSRGRDSADSWREVISSAKDSNWLKEASSTFGCSLEKSITDAIEHACSADFDRGGDFVSGKTEGPSWMKEWYHDSRLGGVLNHHTKEHMPSDLHRYLFVSSYAETFGDSPRLKVFPRDLLPAHKNVLSGKFSDRFRAQMPDMPAKTITSHLSQDGHYFIHPDPCQCRSLTVREAARIQTFPDNYYFMGGKVEQYIQVGNAVPPLLAKMIADQVYKTLA